MKKLIFTVLCFCFINTMAKAQFNFGVGATYLNNLGIQVRADLPLINSFDVEPKLSYYFVDNATSISLDIDAVYDLINFGEENPLYGFMGPAIYRSSSNGVSDSNLGLNIGAGLGISNLRFELKYTTLFCSNCNGQVGGNVAYMF